MSKSRDGMLLNYRGFLCPLLPPPKSPHPLLVHPASSYYRIKAGDTPFIDFSPFAHFDLISQMGHLTPVMERNRGKNPQTKGWDSSWIHQSSWKLCFQLNKELSLWEKDYGVRLGAAWYTDDHTWGLLHKMQVRHQFLVISINGCTIC